MTLEFSLDGLNLFYKLTKFASKPYYNEVDFKGSPMSFILSASLGSPCRCIIDIQLNPGFFNHFASNGQVVHRTISRQDFFTTFLEMKQSGSNYMNMTLSQTLNCLHLSFHTLLPFSTSDSKRSAYLPFLLTYQEISNGSALRDSTVRVALTSFTLRSILEWFNDLHVTLTITLTNSDAKFTGALTGSDVEFDLSVEDRECKIDGVAEGEESQFVILINPIESFTELISWNHTNLVWIYKVNNNTHGVIVISIGLHAQYIVYTGQ